MHTINLSFITEKGTALDKALEYLSTLPTPHGVSLKRSLPQLVCPYTGEVLEWMWLIHIDCNVLCGGVLNIAPTDIRFMESQLNGWLGSIGLTLADWTVTKMDYAYNAVMHDRVEVEALLEALQNCPKQADYMIRKSTYERGISSKNKSVNYKSRGFNVYDKNAERKAKKKPPKPHEVDVIRMEVQLRKEHLKYMKRKGIPRTWDAWVNWTRRAEYMTRGFKYIMRGDYYSLPAAIDIVSASSYKNTDKKKLCRYLEEVYHHGMSGVTFPSSPNTRKKYNDMLYALGVNPLTLNPAYGIRCIPSPFAHCV